jgi:hypothetical protein
MSFNIAKVKALREDSLRRGASASQPTSPFAELDLPGGEDVGGSEGGGLDFLTPGGGVASVVDSVEEMFYDDERRLAEVEKLEKEGAVKLVFPLYAGELDGADGVWSWNVCGGLIGGSRGNRFCTKALKGSTYTHCGVASHAVHKAPLEEGHGYIPSINDRSNTESAFLEPYVASARFPNSIKDLASQALTHEEWIAFLTYLPEEGVLQQAKGNNQELAAEALEKSKLMVSFAVTPATQKPKLPYLVEKVLNTKGSKNLESRFNEENSATDRVELNFEDLEASPPEGWVDTDADVAPFSPSVAQWNALVSRVETLTHELGSAREAVALLADVSESRFDVVDSQVNHLRGSVGVRPSELGPNLPALNLWTNAAKLADEVADTREARHHPKPSSYETMTRSMVDSSQSVAKRQATVISALGNSKAEYVGQVKPLESVLDDMTLDLYSPHGAYNKVLMSGASGGTGGDNVRLRTQVELLSSQVKVLTGNGLGEKGIDANDPALTLLREDVARLALDNQSIKASLGGEIVRIGTEAFHSCDEVKRWIVDNVGPDPGTYEFFFDVTSMLESLQDAGRSSDEAMDSQAISRKANHRSISAARMLNSFGVSIPQVMNKKNHPEPFSLVQSYDKWKTNDGRSGLVEKIRKALQLWETRTTAMLNSRFASPGKSAALLLARNLMGKSMAFWTSLCNWIDEFYGKLISKTEGQKPGGDASLTERKEYDSTLTSVREEAWRLVINVLIDIFQEVALRRADGQAASDMGDDPAMQSAIVLYSALKAHKFMDELIERRFERHPVMAPTFNGFLFSERASHGDIKRLEIKLGEMGNLTRTLQSKVDKKS